MNEHHVVAAPIPRTVRVRNQISHYYSTAMKLYWSLCDTKSIQVLYIYVPRAIKINRHPALSSCARASTNIPSSYINPKSIPETLLHHRYSHIPRRPSRLIFTQNLRTRGSEITRVAFQMKINPLLRLIRMHRRVYKKSYVIGIKLRVSLWCLIFAPLLRFFLLALFKMKKKLTFSNTHSTLVEFFNFPIQTELWIFSLEYNRTV